MSRLAHFRSMMIRARNDAPAPAAQLADDRDAAAAELVAAQTGVVAAGEAYASGLLATTGEGMRSLDDARRDAMIRVDRAKVLVERFEAQTVAANEAKAKAALAQTVEAATAAQAAFQAAVERDLPEMAARARAILALRVDAERTRDTANRALATAGESDHLPDVEAFRALPGLPREVLHREIVDHWVFDDGTVAGHQEKIRTGTDGAGTLMLPNASHSRRFTMKRTFEVIAHLPAERGAVPAPLDVALMVPDLYPATQNGDRRPVTDMRPQGPAREVTKAPPSRSDRMAAGYRA